MKGKEKFWLRNPCVLLDCNIFPTKDLDTNERLNALTRLLIIVTLIMYMVDYKYYLYFFIAGLIVILLMKVLDEKDIQEDFTIPPTYTDGSEPITTIPPLHAEEWQSPPPIYDEYTNIPSYTPCDYFQDERPIFGQYISSDRLLPHNTNETNNRTLEDAQIYMNDEFTKDTMQFRNDMTRTYVNKLDRWYRQGCYDQISPWNSY